ncbi:heparinase II/III family protein [Candidatus Latescibacterota bacterium]
MLKSCIIALMLALTSLAHAQTAIEPYSYSEDFEEGDLNAWASYPHFQDTAFDPFLKLDSIVPGDLNKSLVQTVQAFWNEDTYGGVQKLLDLYLVPGSQIKFSYYFKSHLIPESVTVRLAAGVYGKLDVSIDNPTPNRWNEATITFTDVLRSNKPVAGSDRLHIHAVAILGKLSSADPSMTYFLGVDDIRIDAMRMVPFRFDEPLVHHLSEFPEVIPDRHFAIGETLAIVGVWELDADRVSYTIFPFTDKTQNIRKGSLAKTGDKWRLNRLKLSFPAGMYVMKLRAEKGQDIIAETDMTLCVLPDNPGGQHPRLWFGKAEMESIISKLTEPENRKLVESIADDAAQARENLPLEMVVYDIDQFPADYYLEGGMYNVWFGRVDSWRYAVYYNALAYAFLGDEDAGNYAKDVLVRICSFPSWLHPWARRMGWHSYYKLGSTGNHHSLGYDLLRPLMTEEERSVVRKGLFRNVILPTHRGFVEDNFSTNNTSNWIAMAAGGSLVCQIAIYGDGPDVSKVEPYFTGALLKLATMIDLSIDPDGAYGEGGYLGSSMREWNLSLPALERNFSIDLSKPIRNVYESLLWPGFVRDRKIFKFGDGATYTGITTAFWLLSKYRDPLLGWAYHHLKQSDSIWDIIYDTPSVPRQAPYDLNPIRVFRNVGLTTFKSGWDSDDFMFVMKTGAFYNHHHMDQGSFFLSDHGHDFIIDKHPSGRFYGRTGEPRFLSHNIQVAGHSTILIDNNKQGQRTGDTIGFAPGFDDRAFLYQFLDGRNAAFTSGDIGGVYWGEVKELRRNVLYLKPHALLMLDTVVPNESDVDVTLQYQTPVLGDVNAGSGSSTITKENRTLHIEHLYPENLVAKAEEIPHSASVLSRQRPLERAGMLSLTSRTAGDPLVIANFLTTTDSEKNLSIKSELRNGYGIGEFEGISFAYSTSPGSLYDTGGFTTDALALTWKDGTVFAAVCTNISQNGKILVKSHQPITCELSGNKTRYCSSAEGPLTLSVSSRPSSILINGETITFTHDRTTHTVTVNAPVGEGLVVIK